MVSDTEDAVACASPLLFSDNSLEGPPVRNDDIINNSTTEHPVGNRQSALGDADVDLIEMELYDQYRVEDGELHTLEYLQERFEKIKSQLISCRD